MIETESMETDPVRSAELRSTIYHALALGWRYPGHEAFAVYRSGQYMQELLQFAAKLPHLADLVAQEAATSRAMREELAGMSFEVFENDYAETFGGSSPTPPCPPYEGLYNKRMDRASVLVEISQFYRHCGLRMNGNSDEGELPDYLGAELEFLAFLTFREAMAAEYGLDDFLYGYRWAQNDFLQNHVLGWLPAFAERLAQQMSLPFFPHLMRFTLGFIRADLAHAQELGRSNGHQPAGAAAPDQE